VLTIGGSTHIVQEYVDVLVLENVWAQMGLEERESCMFQLQGYIDQLCVLVPPESGRVEAVDGTGCLNDLAHGDCLTVSMRLMHFSLMT
jgi:hypothetical protein